MKCEKCGKDLTPAVRLFGEHILAFHEGLHKREEKRKALATHLRKLRAKARAAR